MSILNKTLLGISLACMPMMNMSADNVVMNTPASFQVLSLSPNGKWACGVFIDAGMSTYGFRWNLQSGSIDIINNYESTAWDVANDGTVSGDFQDKEIDANGAGMIIPGFWRDGQWHALEMPQDGQVTDGMGTGISPDGRFMTGSICINGIYTPYIWEDGKISKCLNTGNHAVAYAVSADGQNAAGFSTQNNRTACMWASDGNLIYFEDSDVNQSPWNYSRNFSPDGSKLLYWGGWSVESQDEVYLYSIYDLNTGERTKVKAPSYDSDLEFFDISNNGTLVGYNQTRGYIYTDGKGMYLDDYLKERNVDISNYEDFYGDADYYVGQLPIYNVVAISEDEKVLACLYYNKLGQSASMIIKIDQDTQSLGPVEVKANQLTGLNAVGLSWKRPYGDNSIRGYNVYRNGSKINGLLPISVPYFYDNKVTEGFYNYQVSAIHIDGTERYSDAINVVVAPEKAQNPTGIFARQKGFNDGLVSWTAPLSNIVHKSYYDKETEYYTGLSIYMPVEVEMGIKYDKNELAQYKGHQLTEVTFYPMSRHDRWAINVYTYDQAGALQLLYSQPISSLNYSEFNTIKLDTPVDLPSGDMIVAIEVMIDAESSEVIGAQNGKTIQGYSDLLRLKSEDDFYSAYERGLNTSLTITRMAWAIDLGLKDQNKPDDEVAHISHYNLYLDGDMLAQTTETKQIIESLSDGIHDIKVEAVYSDGQISDAIDTSLKIAAAYKGVYDVVIDKGEEGSTAIKASWERPVDTDLKSVTYTTATTHATGIKGVSENGYALMVGAEYPVSMVRGYDGYKVKSFRFYPLADALFTFMLYEGEELKYELEVDEFEIGQWNEILLPDEVLINGNCKYRLVLDCFDPEPDVDLMALDNSMPHAYQSDLYSITNGDTWNSLSYETGAKGSWMIGMEIEDTEVKELDIEGYDVVIDFKVRNESMLHDTEFTYDFGKTDTRNHTLTVNTYYNAVAKSITGKACTFKLATAGIADGMIANIKLERESNYLVADGATSITVFSSAGAEVAKSASDKVDISSLAAGIYVVQISTPNGTSNQKINIQR